MKTHSRSTFKKTKTKTKFSISMQKFLFLKKISNIDNPTRYVSKEESMEFTRLHLQLLNAIAVCNKNFTIKSEEKKKKEKEGNFQSRPTKCKTSTTNQKTSFLKNDQINKTEVKQKYPEENYKTFTG